MGIFTAMHSDPDVVIVDTGYEMVNSFYFVRKFSFGVTNKTIFVSIDGVNDLG